MSPALLQLAVLSALGLGGASAWAQNALTVPVEYLHLSNPTLAPLSEGGVNLVRISPSYSLVNVTGDVRTELSLGAVLEKSSDTALSSNRADPRLGLNWQWTQPTSQLVLRGLLQKVSTRTSEFDATGEVVVDSTRRNLDLGAEWTKELSPVTRLTLGAGRTQADYETPLLVGYRESSASAEIERTLAEGVQVSLEARYGMLQPNDLSLFAKAQSSSLFVDYEAALNETWSVGLGVGTVRTTAETREQSEVGRLQLRYQGERLNSTVDWRREVAPSGSLGGYGRTDGYRWANGYALTSQTTLEMSFGQSRSLDQGGGSGRVATVGLRSALTQFWTMTLGYEDRKSTPAAGPGARGKSIGFGFSYAHPDF